MSKAGDRVFLGLSTTAAWLIMVMLAGVAIFLIVKAWPAITSNWATSNPLQDRTSGNTADQMSFWSYVGPLVFGTLWSAFLALLMGAPVAIGIALFISHYAPRRLAGTLGYLIDLLAAVPSIVFGLWGVFVIRDFFKPLNGFLNQTLGWLPFFQGTENVNGVSAVSATGSTILAGAVVLAVMILPIITSISREIFLQTPVLHEEAALALGATRWEMIQMAVLPYARSGIVSATLLGLGRALGETMAIAIIVSPHLVYSFKLITDGENPATIAGNIALQFSGSNGLQQSALVATGLMLFVISFAVNFIARIVVARTAPDAKRRTRKVKTA
ncbi:MAG: phosphate ABC transporter permease subunit PstC [Pseudolysinimonas sp.]